MEEKLVQYRDYQRKIDPSKFIQQFRITELAIRLGKERSSFNKEISNPDLEIKKIMKVSRYNIFIVNIFLKAYFLDSSLKNKVQRAIFSLLAFIFSRDIRKLLIRDFKAYKLPRS